MDADGVIAEETEEVEDEEDMENEEAEVEARSDDVEDEEVEKPTAVVACLSEATALIDTKYTDPSPPPTKRVRCSASLAKQLTNVGKVIECSGARLPCFQNLTV